MSFFIVRISETEEKMTRTRLPGDNGDTHPVMQAMDKVLSTYKSHGKNEEHGYRWARDDGGNQFRFEITGN